MENANYTIALLIDTDNVSAKYMEALEKELIILGKVTYRRMYGDFTRQGAESWRALVNEFSITPVQQYTYTTGKNATDHRMVIDAMDILYSHNVNAFCILSSDSDFTGLAKRLRESNMFVIGAGERKTPASFVKACNRFFVLEDLLGKDENVKKSEPKTRKKVTKDTKQAQQQQPSVSAATPEKEKTVEEVTKPLTKREVEKFVTKILANGSPRMSLELLINKIYQAYPQFDFKTFGAKKSYDFFSEKKFTITSGDNNNLFIELKQ